MCPVITSKCLELGRVKLYTILDCMIFRDHLIYRSSSDQVIKSLSIGKTIRILYNVPWEAQGKNKVKIQYGSLTVNLFVATS